MGKNRQCGGERGGRGGGEGTRPNKAVLITTGCTLNNSVDTEPGGGGVEARHMGGAGGVKMHPLFSCVGGYSILL